MKRIYFLTLLATLSQAHAATVHVNGILLEKGTRKPLIGVNVYVLPAKLRATTDDGGHFRIEGVPEGPFSWVVNLSGYEKLELADEAHAVEPITERRLLLERSAYQGFETTIYGRGEKRDDTSKTVTREQFMISPGVGSDPVRAVQDMPGVNRTNAFDSSVVIQGSSPSDTAYTIDSHPIPLIFHFGGLTSVLIPEALDHLDLLQAGYGPEFGRANGGYVNAYIRSPKTDRFHGSAFFDLANVGAMFEGPIGEKTSLLAGGRVSDWSPILGLLAQGNPSLDLTVAPLYSDLNAVLETELTPRDHLRFLWLGSLDIVKFLFKQPFGSDPTIRGNFDQETYFVRFIPELTHKHSSRTTSRFSLGLGGDYQYVNVGTVYYRQTSWVLSTRGEVERKMLPGWTTFLGFDNVYTANLLSYNVPSFYSAGGVDNSLSTGANQTSSPVIGDDTVALYSRNELKIPLDDRSPLTLLPNLRFDYFNRTKEVFLEPRPAVRVAVSDTFKLRAASGIYYQPPSINETDPSTGNPDLKSPRAYHVTAGAEKDFREGLADGFVASLDGFYKYLDNLDIGSTAFVVRNGQSVPEYYNNQGAGRAFGAMTDIRFGWRDLKLSLRYTLSRSTRWNSSTPEYVFGYDQTHAVGILGRYDWGKWTFSGRFRYTTGNPYTGVVGAVYDVDNDVYVPLRGPLYGQRLSPFVQLDLRIDKKWIFDNWILTAYLDVQNVTNAQNPAQLIYSYDYATSAAITGLPILPSVGLRGEF